VEVQRVIVQKLEREGEVPDQHAHRWRDAADRHLDGEGRAGGVHASAHAARPTGDEDRVARIAPHHDHLVAAEKRGHRARLEHLARLEVGDGVERERPRDARHRVEVHRLDVPVPLDQLLDSFGGELTRSAQWHGGRRRVGVRDPGPQGGAPLGIELDGQVLEAHDVLGS
jgi:hypothetical protein